jgi:DNA-binding SARP family transcriptional activator
MKVTRTCQKLLAYLLLQRNRMHRRELLAGLFWADQSQNQARRCLNSTLWRLRQILEPQGIPRGTYLQSTDLGEIGFNLASDYWLDVATFEAKAAPILSKPIQHTLAADVQTLENVLQLYTGELLEGFYDDWALRERERLRRLYLNSLAHLMYYYKFHQAFAESLTCGQQILDHDPLREEIHRDMMCLYHQNGQYSMAARQYTHCCEILRDELNVPPMEETQMLHAQIMRSSQHAQRPITPLRAPCDSHQALRQLDLAVQDFDAARAQLNEAIQLVKQFVVLPHSREPSGD